MHKRIPKTFSIILILFIILNTFGFLFLNLAWTSSSAAEPTFKIPDLQIKIPGLEKLSEVRPCPNDQSKKCVNWIGEYISGIYKYAIGIVGIIATVVMMFGGVMWIVAGGNATRIGEAKAWIGAALTGLVLALTSYVILYQINPSLTQFKPIEVSVAKPMGCCENPKNKDTCDFTIKENCQNGWRGKGYTCYQNVCVEEGSITEGTVGCCTLPNSYQEKCQTTTEKICKAENGQYFNQQSWDPSATCSEENKKYVCKKKQANQAADDLKYECKQAPEQDSLLEQGVYAVCDSSVCHSYGKEELTSCPIQDRFCYVEKTKNKYGCDNNECNYLLNKKPCHTDKGEKGYCYDKKCEKCKTTGAECTNSWTTNYECCNGDCLYGWTNHCN